jgi:hypothetical protein
MGLLKDIGKAAWGLTKSSMKAGKAARDLKKVKRAPAAVAKKIQAEKDADKATLIAKKALRGKGVRTAVKTTGVAGAAGAAAGATVGYKKGKKSVELKPIPKAAAEAALKKAAQTAKKKKS